MIRRVIARIRRRSWRREISWRRARRKTFARRRCALATAGDLRSIASARPELLVIAAGLWHASVQTPALYAIRAPGCPRVEGGGVAMYPSANERRRRESVTDGTVIIIGGAEDKFRDRVILNRFVSLAGGRDATIVVISTASSLGTEAGERYRQIFSDLGVATVRTLHATTRPQANDESSALLLRDATGIFLTGGNQLKLASTIGGTRLADAMLDRFQHGAVVAGTSAGASAMSSHMIAFGASGATPKHRMAQISAGLGMLPGVIIDQHFQQRNRLGRLLSLIAQNPSLLGLGVDEDTAGVVGPDHVMEVIGRGSITVVDGAASETDAWEIRGHKPLMISGVVLHSLPAGYRFDLRRRQRLATPALRALPGGSEIASG
jgi:cyanophycinase